MFICAVTSVNTVVADTTAKSPQSVKNKAPECRIRAIGISKDASGQAGRRHGRSGFSGNSVRMAKEMADVAGLTKPAGMDQLPRMTSSADKEKLVRIEGTKENTSEPVTLQEFEFDSRGWPVKRVNSYYDGQQKPYPVEIYEYVWDEDGYCVSSMVYSDAYSYGERHDYVYNDKNLGIMETVYTYQTDAADKWLLSWKGEYKYDDRGNIIEETISVYDAYRKQWLLSKKNKAAWDEQGQQTLFEPYLWNGLEWAGDESQEKQEMTWTGKQYSRVKSYIWDSEAKEYFWYCDYTVSYNGAGVFTGFEKKFYNKTLGNWDGCETYYGQMQRNSKSVVEVDGKGREMHVRDYETKAPGEYAVCSETTYDWTDNADGTSGCTVKAAVYEDSPVGLVVSESHEKYDAEGRQTFLLEKQYDRGLQMMLNSYECSTEYNDNGDELSKIEYSYTADKENRKVGTLAMYNTYDEMYNPVESVNRIGGQDDGAADAGTVTDGYGVKWVNFTRFIYTYAKDNIRVGKEKYMWQGGAWVLNEKSADEYDFSTSADNIVAWDGYNVDYKLLSTSSSLLSDGVLDTTVNTYFYSPLTSGISGVTDGKGGVRVWPTVVDDGFNVEASEGARVSVYSMNGTRVATSASGWVSVSGLPSGIYIVSVDGCKTKIIKK